MRLSPFMQELTSFKVSEELLKERFAEMVTQNYECAVIFGLSGIWFSTRHYAGKTVEIDHVYIREAYRN